MHVEMHVVSCTTKKGSAPSIREGLPFSALTMAAALMPMSGTPNGNSANERLTATPSLVAKAGPALMLASADVDQPFAALAATSFISGVLAFNVDLNGD